MGLRIILHVFSSCIHLYTFALLGLTSLGKSATFKMLFLLVDASDTENARAGSEPETVGSV